MRKRSTWALVNQWWVYEVCSVTVASLQFLCPQHPNIFFLGHRPTCPLLSSCTSSTPPFLKRVSSRFRRIAPPPLYPTHSHKWVFSWFTAWKDRDLDKRPNPIALCVPELHTAALSQSDVFQLNH